MNDQIETTEENIDELEELRDLQVEVNEEAPPKKKKKSLEERLQDRWTDLLHRKHIYDIKFSDDMTYVGGSLNDGTKFLYWIDDLLPKTIDKSVFKKGMFNNAAPKKKIKKDKEESINFTPSERLIREDDNFEFLYSSMTDTINDDIKKKGMLDYCFLTKDKKNGKKEYVLFDVGGKAFYASTKAEDIGAHISMIHLSEEKKTKIDSHSVTAVKNFAEV